MLRDVAMALLTIVGLAGCASAQPASPATESEPLFPVATSADQPQEAGTTTSGTDTLAARLDEDAEAFLRSAEQRIISDCMSAAGFEYVPAPPPPDDPLAVAADRHFRYGTDDVEWAQQHGYGLTRPLASPAHDLVVNGPNERHFQSLSEEEKQAWDEALNGSEDAEIDVQLDDGRTVFTRTEGCVADARLALYGDLGEYLFFTYTVRGITEDAQAAVYDHDEYTQAVDQWSECMSGHGHPAADTFQLREQLRSDIEGLSEGEAWKIEQQTATMDATCNAQADLHETARRLEIELTESALGEAQDTVVQYLEMRASALEAAEESLDEVQN